MNKENKNGSIGVIAGLIIIVGIFIIGRLIG